MLRLTDETMTCDAGDGYKVDIVFISANNRLHYEVWLYRPECGIKQRLDFAGSMIVNGKPINVDDLQLEIGRKVHDYKEPYEKLISIQNGGIYDR